MVRFVARRLAAGVVLLFVISFLSYVLLSLPGTDVGRQLLGQSAAQELVDAKNHELGLDQPILTQYWNWLVAALQGDFGKSWFTSESVLRAIGNRLPVTLSLMIGVTLITAVVSFAVGIWAGVRRGVVDRALQIFAVLGYALPGFLVTLVLLQARGHIVRNPHPTDRRSLQISVTPETRRVARDTVGRHHARRYEAAARLTPSEREVVIRFLRETTEAIDLKNADWMPHE